MTVDRGTLLNRDSETTATKFDGDRQYSLSDATTRFPLTLTVNAPSYGAVRVNGRFIDVGTPVQVAIHSIEADDQITIDYVDAQNREHRHVIHARPSGMPAYVTTGRISQPGELALTVSGGAFKAYLMLLDRDGNLLFYRRSPDTDLSDLKKVRINGKTYDTYIAGTRILPIGYFEGKAYVMDESFRVIKVIDGLLPNPTKGRSGLVQSENHDFLLLGEDHYMVSAYAPVVVNSVPGVPGPVRVVDSILQEVKNGQVVFEWESAEHPELFQQSEEGNGYDATNWSDYVHFNSVWVDPADGNLVASFRNLNAVFKIDRSSGAILWRYGGVADAFTLSAHQMPQGQHSAKVTADGSLLYFDNNTTCIGVGPALARFHTPDSSGQNICQQRDASTRIVKATLDQQNRRVVSFKEWRFPNAAEATAVSGLTYQVTTYRGSVQELTNGHFVVGFGSRAIGDRDVAELDPVSGQMVFELFFDRAGLLPAQAAVGSYRANFTPD